MAHIQVVYFEISATLLLAGIITIAMEGFLVVPPAIAQAGENMTSPMIESTRFHLKAADGLLMEGNTQAALDQINLAGNTNESDSSDGVYYRRVFVKYEDGSKLHH
jgi:hypothetical protein